jgi:hypothetical protein
MKPRRPHRPRTITLVPTFTNPRSSKTPAPAPLVGLFYGKTEGWWFIHVDGTTHAKPRADWREASGQEALQ